MNGCQILHAIGKYASDADACPFLDISLFHFIYVEEEKRMRKRIIILPFDYDKSFLDERLEEASDKTRFELKNIEFPDVVTYQPQKQTKNHWRQWQTGGSKQRKPFIK